jgi:hypothetical protein
LCGFPVPQANSSLSMAIEMIIALRKGYKQILAQLKAKSYQEQLKLKYVKH